MEKDEEEKETESWNNCNTEYWDETKSFVFEFKPGDLERLNPKPNILEEGKDYFNIKTNNDLATICCTLQENEKFLCIDSEWIRERTYFFSAGLIQICGKNATPFLIYAQKITNFEPLKKLFQDENILKILHGCEEDLLFFDQILNEVIPTPFFDTQKAAQMLGLSELPPKYSTLVDLVLKKQIGACSEARSCWTDDTLTETQIKYACEDVKYLPKLYKKLKIQLKKEGRYHWMKEECEQEKARLYERKNNHLLSLAKRYRSGKLQKLHKLDRLQLTMLNELCSWRKTKAAQIDKPVRFIRDDKVLFDLAKTATEENIDQHPKELQTVILKVLNLEESQLLPQETRSLQASQFVDLSSKLALWKESKSASIPISSQLLLSVDEFEKVVRCLLDPQNFIQQNEKEGGEEENVTKEEKKNCQEFCLDIFPQTMPIWRKKLLIQNCFLQDVRSWLCSCCSGTKTFLNNRLNTDCNKLQ